MKNYLGFLTAEDIEEQDKYLPRAFILTKSIKRSLDQNICFICGRKGSGKTAVATRLKGLLNKDGSQFYKSHLMIVEKDYNELHKTFYEDLMAIFGYDDNIISRIEELYYHIWLYIIEIAAIKATLKIADINKSFPDEVQDLMIIFNQYPTIELNPCDLANFKVLEILENAKSTAMPLTRLTLDTKLLRQTPIHVAAIKSLVHIIEKNKIVITIDTLEQYDLSDHKVYPFKGMCKAVKEIQTSKYLGNIQIKCFLPAEMTENLFSDNLLKYYEYTQFLLWTSTELLEFVARRFAILLEDIGKVDESKSILTILKEKKNHVDLREKLLERFWFHFFPKKIRNKFDWPEHSLAYLLRHTQKRPREVLSCLDFIIDYSIENSEFPDDRISQKSFQNGIHDDYNIYQLLSDNLAVFSLPRNELSLSEVASEILTNENTIFTGASFSRFARRALSILSTQEYIDKASFAKDIILRSGLVGVVRKYNDSEPAHIWNDLESGSKCKYYVTEFEYLIPGHLTINDNALCAVHPILSDRLHLKPPDNDLGVVYPMPEQDDIVKLTE